MGKQSKVTRRRFLRVSAFATTGVVAVLGAAGGIGSAAIRLFTELGARVGCTYHATSPRLPPGVLSERCDVSDRDDVMRTFEAIASRLGGIDVLLHAAGLHQQHRLQPSRRHSLSRRSRTL